MNWKIQLADDGEHLRVTTDGPFTLADQQQMFAELCGHPAVAARAPMLFDNRRIELRTSNVDVMRRSVEIVQKFIEAHGIERLAGLVDQGANFGVGRQFETLTELAGGHGFRLFKSEPLALSWLRGEMD